MRVDAVTATPFRDATAHLDAELGWARLLLVRYLAAHHQPGEDSRGLYVPGREVGRLLHAPPVVDLPEPELEDRLKASRLELDRRLIASAVEGVELPFNRLIDRFPLEPLDRWILLALLAPASDSRFERAWCFAWNDFGRKLPTAGFLADLLGGSPPGARDVLRRLAPGSPLVVHGLVHLEDEGARDLPLRGRQLHLSGRIASLLLGGTGSVGVAPELQARLLPLPDPSEPLVIGAELLAELARLGGQLGQAGAPAWCNLYGPCGTGRRSAGRWLAARRGQRLLQADLAPLLAAPEEAVGRLAALLREARLHGAMLLLDAPSAPPPDREGLAPGLAVRLTELVQRADASVFVRSLERADWLGLELAGARLLRFGLPLPSAPERALLWSRFLDSRLTTSVDGMDLGARYALSGGDIRLAATQAVERLAEGSPEGLPALLERECQQRLGERLGKIAQRIATGFGWPDVVLPVETRARLEEIVHFARHQRRVFEQWGFGRKFPYGKGLTALFEGPPGTGKTMVASVIARELGLDLYRVDLSSLVDKYVGETEKNLSRLFAAAQDVPSVILFDEADSLFTKRTEVRSSVDRYANLEVNHLLQLFEQFGGVAVLTTNHGEVIDEAFRRRIKFRISFRAPSRSQRRRLWALAFPAEAPLARDVDWDELAEAFEMSGGHIKNSALRAAVMASAAGASEVGQELIWQSAVIEYEAMGKLVDRSWQVDEPDGVEEEDQEEDQEDEDQDEDQDEDEDDER